MVKCFFVPHAAGSAAVEPVGSLLHAVSRSAPTSGAETATRRARGARWGDIIVPPGVRERTDDQVRTNGTRRPGARPRAREPERCCRGGALTGLGAADPALP